MAGRGGVCRGTYLWNHSSVQVCRNLVCLSAVSSQTVWCGFVNLIDLWVTGLRVYCCCCYCKGKEALEDSMV